MLTYSPARHALVPARSTALTALSTALGRLVVLTALVVALLGSLLVAAPGTASADAGLGQAAVAEASKHAGKPYRYGRVGPDAFDCSGFVLHVFRQLGKELPRTSGDQYAVSTKVAKSDKRPGDLIAIHNSDGRVTHVAIYAGDGNMWVASTGSDRVRLQAIYTSRYRVGRFG